MSTCRPGCDRRRREACGDRAVVGEGGVASRAAAPRTFSGRAGRLAGACHCNAQRCLQRAERPHPSYTLEWTSQMPDDAGVALARLFSEEMEPVLQRLNQLPENSFIHFLAAGGIAPRPATP